MAEENPDKQTREDVSSMLKDLDRDLDRMLEQMEKISVNATWMVYEMIMTRSDPALAERLRRLEESFSQCKEEIEKNWKDMLDETKKTSQNYDGQENMLSIIHSQCNTSFNKE